MLACVDALTDGLVPDGKMGAIIPRGKVAVWTPMWRGLLDLAKRGNPSLREIRAFVVYQIEIDKRAFVVDNARGIERHTPWQLLGLDYTPKDDDIACAYARAVVRDENGNESIEWRILWRANLIKRAERSANPNDKLWSPAWIQWFGEMAQAKAIRALCDMLTMPPAYLDAVERDDERQRASVSQIEDDAPLPPSNGKPGLAAEIRGAGVALAAGETAGEGSPS
jgi:recombinational DNA repair protein RecT